MTTADTEIYQSRAGLARRARRDLLAVVLIVAGGVGFDVCMWMVNSWAGVAVLCLYIAGVGVHLGMDREGARG